MDTPNLNRREIEQIVQDVLRRTIQQSDILPGGVKQRHLEAMIIFRGLAADRPDGTTEVLAYFATDTDTLSIWNGSAWKDEVLT